MKYINNVADHPQKEVIEKRLKIIKFFDQFGQEATKKAFSKSRSTVYLWKQNLRYSQGKLSALAPKSRAPNNKRGGKKDPKRLLILLKTTAKNIQVLVKKQSSLNLMNIVLNTT